MADDYSKFLESGYYKSTNIATLQEQLANYATDDETLRSKAVAQYQPTYDATKLSYQNQIKELAASQDSQARSLDEQYIKSQNALDSSLNKRGLGRSSLVSTQGVALQNQRNQALADLNAKYAAQTNSINSQIQQLDVSYAQQIESRINELRSENQTQLTQLQLQIAELQYNAYQAYQAYLENQKKNSSSGGGARSSATKTQNTGVGSTPPSSTNSSADYYKGSTGVVNGALATGFVGSLAGVIASTPTMSNLAKTSVKKATSTSPTKTPTVVKGVNKSAKTTK